MLTQDKTKTTLGVPEVQSIIQQQGRTRNEKLQALCDLLRDQVDEFDWVGFYLVDPEQERTLILGPFTGEPTDHTQIPFGKGICGQAADSHETYVVQDVSKADNYLACSVDVKSEIVVPVMKEGRFLAELDVDSHTKGAITKQHEEMLEEICDITAALF